MAGGVRLALFRQHSRYVADSYIHSSSRPAFSVRGICALPSLIPSNIETNLRYQLERNDIFMPAYTNGANERAACPKCKASSRGGKSLIVNISQDGRFAMWNCLHSNCLNKGSLRVQDSNMAIQSILENKLDKKVSLIQEGQSGTSSRLEDPSEEVAYYFEKRSISRETLVRNGVKQTYHHQHGVVIAFPYKMKGQVVNCKYRTLGKIFWQEKQCLKVLYGVDDIASENEIIIVEGEIDKLSFEEAGFLNCVSVPDGAPAKVSQKNLAPEAEDKKFSYIWNCKEYFNKASRIILATDADAPGQALAEELARRLGRERCWRVHWPKSKDGKKQLKDANEVLVELGPDGLRSAIHAAELYPIRGLFTFSNFFKELDDYFCAMDGDATGVSTGWPSLDDYYRVVPGELTLVTGVPGSGKSEWIDALMVNLVKLKGWTFGLCSMENKVREHGRKLLEKFWKKPFFDAMYSENKERISPEELDLGKQWMNENFFLIRCEDDELPSVDWVLKLAKAAVMRHGIRGLVIDPYNELDHQRGSQQTETEYVSKMLTKMKRFAQHYGCHVWFVAHPKQMQFWHGEAPNLYDISGSAHFVNKCDNGLVIHRNRDPTKGPSDRVEILIRKARNKVSGTLGEVTLIYDRVTGLYSDLKQNGSDVSW